MSTAATMRCAICVLDKPQGHFQQTSLGRKPMCRLCCFGRVTELSKPPTGKPAYVPVNSLGRIIGQSHHRAKLLDNEIDLVFALREAGLSYQQVAEKMGISKSCAAHVLKGRRRCQTPERWVQVVPGDAAVKRKTRPPTTKAKPKSAQLPAVHDGVAELQKALRTWR